MTADRIYRPFFVAGISTVLTLGCLWGAINLLTIGWRQSFTAANYSWVLAHAHAMVFGFVGFFMMGFAYQVFPRVKKTTVWKPGLALASLPLMITGIVLQTIAHMLTPPSLPLAVVAAVIQLGAVAIFASVIVMTTRRAQRPEFFDRFVYAALGWFVLAALANPIVFKLFELPGSREHLLFNLATFNIPYRDIELLGIAVVMILGVSLRLLPRAYGLREPRHSWQAFLFWGINGSILAGVVLFIVGMASGNHWLLLLQWLTAFVFLAAAVGTPIQYRLFRPTPEHASDRSLKFVRASYIWFAIATVMLVATPLYNFGIYMPLTGSSVPFSHAFFGAYRHALTVGFIMMTIVGVSSKLAPTLSGFDMRRATSLWPTFILLNLGNALRVGCQIATDFTPRAYSIMGFSGFIELIGLGLWGFELIRNMGFKNNLDNRAYLAVDYRAMRIGKLVRKLRVAVAFGLALWCAGTGCVLVSYAHSAAMTSANPGGPKSLGSATASAGSHDCCKARHPALKRTARSQTTPDGIEQVAVPESSAPDGARSCCPLTSGSFVTASRASSNESNLSSVTQGFLPPAMAVIGAAPAEYPLHLPSQNKAYLLDCVFLI